MDDLLDLLLWLMPISDWLVLIVACAIGYVGGLFVPLGWCSIFTSMLLSYHLFLAWLVSTAGTNMEIVRPLTYPAAIHLACLVVIVSIGSGRLFVPHFDIVCCGVAVLARVERNWLFQPAKALS